MNSLESANDCLLILVLKYQQYEKYATLWGNLYAILVMPSKWDASVIGRARSVMFRAATALGIDVFCMMDDSWSGFSERILSHEDESASPPSPVKLHCILDDLTAVLRHPAYQQVAVIGVNHNKPDGRHAWTHKNATSFVVLNLALLRAHHVHPQRQRAVAR